MWNEKELKAIKTVYNNIDYLISDIVIEDDGANICLMTIKEQLPIIKQALLKAQEPKQYLKWEDLKKLGKEIKVKLNGVEYLLCKKNSIRISGILSLSRRKSKTSAYVFGR